MKMLNLAYRRSKPRYRRIQLRSRTAFTLLEILVVVVILAVIAMLAGPMLSSAGGIQIRSAANVIAADIEYAKSMAISRGQNYSVVFDVSADSYWIEDAVGNTIEHPVNKGSNYMVSFGGNTSLDKVDIINVDFGSMSSVTFNLLGNPDNGGTVQLQADGSTATIAVEAVTGFVSIF